MAEPKFFINYFCRSWQYSARVVILFRGKPTLKLLYSQALFNLLLKVSMPWGYRTECLTEFLNAREQVIKCWQILLDVLNV